MKTYEGKLFIFSLLFNDRLKPRRSEVRSFSRLEGFHGFHLPHRKTCFGCCSNGIKHSLNTLLLSIKI